MAMTELEFLQAAGVGVLLAGYDQDSEDPGIRPRLAFPALARWARENGHHEIARVVAALEDRWCQAVEAGAPLGAE